MLHIVRKHLPGVAGAALVLIVAACTAAPIVQAEPEGATPPPAALAAQRWLAEHLARGVEQVEIVDFEQAEWPDSCLGLEQAHESCLAAITPGWRVMLRVDGQDYEARTDATGAVVRLNTPAALDGLAGTEWTLISFGPAGAETPVSGDTPLTLAFGADGQASGQGGCNSFGGEYSAQAGRLAFGALFSTKRACADDALNRQEADYLAALQAAQRYEAAGDQLTITYEGGVLNFSAAPAPTDGLAGTAWGLVSYGPAEAPTPVVAGSTVTLSFGHDGQAGGEGGCNGYGAAYEVDGGQVAFGDVVSTLRLCADEAVMQQEAAYFEALRTAGRFEILGETLTLAYEGGVLTFAAAGQPGPDAPALEARLPGIVDFYGDGSQGVLNAPESVQAGQDFQVTVATFGGGCERAGETEALPVADGAAIFVYDFTSAIGPAAICPAILQRLEHTVTLRFDEPGEMTIRVWGRRVGPETPTEGAPTVLEHTLVVR